MNLELIRILFSLHLLKLRLGILAIKSNILTNSSLQAKTAISRNLTG